MSDIRDFFIKTLDEAESGKSFSHFSKVISSHTMIPCTCTTYLLLPQTFLFVNPRCGELYFTQFWKGSSEEKKVQPILLLDYNFGI